MAFLFPAENFWAWGTIKKNVAGTVSRSFTYCTWFLFNLCFKWNGCISNLYAGVSNTITEDRHFKPGLEVNFILSVRGTPVHVRSARRQSDLELRWRLHGTDLKANSIEDLVLIRIIHIRGDSDNILYAYKMSGVKDGPSTLPKMTTVDYYVWDSRMTLKVDGHSYSKSGK